MRGIVCVVMMLLYCHSNNQKISYILFNDEPNRIITYSGSAKQFCKQHHYNSTVFFLIDMSIHSGKKRFFVINMNTDSVITSGLVAHGVCGIFFSSTATFSNEPGFGC